MQVTWTLAHVDCSLRRSRGVELVKTEAPLTFKTHAVVTHALSVLVSEFTIRHTHDELEHVRRRVLRIRSRKRSVLSATFPN